jgi:hypothetical protein
MPAKTLRQILPKGYAKAIYERMNGKYSDSLIRKVIYGERKNDEILNEALSYLEDIKKEEIKVKNDFEARLKALEEMENAHS